ncbi:hypothetical protein E4U41_002403, partial [Claviceps citrina]
MAGVVDPELANKATNALDRPAMSDSPPRFVIVGAGSRGKAYAQAIDAVCNGVVSAVCEPLRFQRETLGRRHIWGDAGPSEGQSFASWTDFV